MKKYEDLFVGLIASVCLILLDNSTVTSSSIGAIKFFYKRLVTTIEVDIFVINFFNIISFIGIILTIYFLIRIFIRLIINSKRG